MRRVTATDIKSASRKVDLSFRYCSCLGQCNCYFDIPLYTSNDDRFAYMTSDCRDGYTGNLQVGNLQVDTGNLQVAIQVTYRWLYG
jgi:hypothetical protein